MAAVSASMARRDNFWNVTFKDVMVEKGILTAEGTKGGRHFISNVRMAGPAVPPSTLATHSTLQASRDSLLVVSVEAVDTEGVHVQNFSEPIRWQLAGPGRLVSPDQYQSDIHRRHAQAGSFYTVTPTCAVIHHWRQAGSRSPHSRRGWPKAL